MTLIQYFRSVFGGSSVSIFETIQRIDSLLSSIFENLPNTIFIQNKKTNTGYQIDFTKDEKISAEEYVALHSVFSQFVTIVDPDYVVTCTYGTENKQVDFNTLLQKFPGMHKMVRAVLFLDFHNAQEFINNSISLYELMLPPKFSLLPSSDKKDAYVSQLKDMQKQMTRYESEFDVYTVDYAKFTKDIDTLGRVIQDIEAEITIANQEYIEKSEEVISTKDLQRDSRRVSALVDKLSRSMDVNNELILEITKKNRITITDASRQKELRRINTRRARLIESLNGRQMSIINDIDQQAKSAFMEKLSGQDGHTRQGKMDELKSNLRVAEERRKQVHTAMTDIKKHINELKLEILSVEERMRSDGAPVDIGRLSAENLLKLDADCTLHEKTARFLLSYFMDMNPQGFLTVAGRRELLKKVYPELAMKSVSLLQTSGDFLNFIEVQD